MNWMMIAIAVICLLLSAAAAARGAEPTTSTTAPAAIDLAWQKHADNAGLIPPAPGGAKGEVVKVTGPGTVRVLDIDNPNLAHHTYAIVGRVKYENVKGTGYLEMWNTFPDGGAFFSRTLGSGGPMQSLNGSSDWRPFVLPFFAKPGMVPSKLEVNVVVPEGGTVYLEPAKLVQNLDPNTGLPKGFTLPPSASGASRGSMGAWWNEWTSGWIAGLGGAVLGLLATVVGLLAGHGRARRLVLALLVTILIVGGTSLIVGVVALSIGQPYRVYYPLLLTGLLATLLPLVILPALRRRYEELEFRRMTALDATS